MNETLSNFTSCVCALKEWACVVESLGEGAQCLMIRKGGIHDKKGVFEPQHRFFALFPTFEHQKEEDLNASGRYWLEKLSLSEGLKEPDPIPLKYLACARRVAWLDGLEKIPPLALLQALNVQALEKRFHYGDRPGFFVLLVRVYRLKHEVLLPRLSSYAGCRSWITLVPPMETPALEPVLSDKAFAEQESALSHLLGN